MKSKLFNAAIAAKSKSLQRGVLTHKIYDTLIFNKIKVGLGMDHIRLMISGSAPLNENVMTFFRCMLGVPVVEGTVVRLYCSWYFRYSHVDVTHPFSILHERIRSNRRFCSCYD